MRCSNCNKFVPYDTEVDPEEESEPEVTDQNVTATYRRVLTCGECGEELKEATIEIEGEISCDKPCGEHEPAPGTASDKELGNSEAEHEWEIESCTATATERSEGRGRGLKTFYGVAVEIELKCTACGAEHTQSFDGDEQASSFDELV